MAKATNAKGHPRIVVKRIEEVTRHQPRRGSTRACHAPDARSLPHLASLNYQPIQLLEQTDFTDQAFRFLVVSQTGSQKFLKDFPSPPADGALAVGFQAAVGAGVVLRAACQCFASDNECQTAFS